MSEPIFTHTHAIDVAASPEAVYDLISDLTRHGEWSAQNVGGEWLDGATGKVGDWFEGRNKAGKMEWSAKVEISEATRGQEFGFWTLGKETAMVHWLYRMEASGDGTKLSEHYHLNRAPDAVAKGGEAAIKGWCDGVKAGMEKNLAAIKATAEA